MIPFYIFSHESRFKEYNKNEDKLAQLKAEYIEIVSNLDEWMQRGIISVYTKKTILEMSRKVLENIASKYQNVREGVISVMGGKVLEYEAKTILKEGMQKGIQKGALKQANETAWNLHNLGMDEDTIAKMINVQVSLVREWFLEHKQ